MTKMNAMAVHEFGPPENLKPTEVEIREPQPGEILIRVQAAAVNPADLGMRDGRYQWPEPLRWPLIPGYDIAGIVETGTDELPVGTPVIAYTKHTATQTGSYAEYATLPAELVAAAPATLDWAHAAALPLAGLTAQTALHHLGLAKGDTLLVNRPDGAVGRFVAQLAEHAGIEVRTPDTVAGQVDAALDAAGADAALEAFAKVRDGGRYATVVPQFWIPGGQFTSARGIDPVTVFVDPAVGNLAELSRLADAGVLRPHVADRLPLTEAAEAHRRMGRGGARGKLVLVP